MPRRAPPSKACIVCGEPLRRKRSESWCLWQERRHCSHAHAMRSRTLALMPSTKQVAELVAQGWQRGAIMEALGLSRCRYKRRLRLARQEGLLPPASVGSRQQEQHRGGPLA